MNYLDKKIKKHIFINPKNPLTLILNNKEWLEISKEPETRAVLVIKQYGSAHALFHTIRFGFKFISLELVRILIEKEDAILSRYFAQRLLLQFGKADMTLVSLRLKNDINNNNNNHININNNNNNTTIRDNNNHNHNHNHSNNNSRYDRHH